MNEDLGKLVEAIKDRHSVRSYMNLPIEQEKLDKLSEIIEECNKEGDLHIQLCNKAGKTYSRIMNKVAGLGSAPSVIACVGRDDATLDERVGYYGEKIVLCAQQLGLSTCWTGTFSAKNVPVMVSGGERLVIVIAVGYGANGGRPHKSKSMEQVLATTGQTPKWFDFGVDMALLAPTAINQQKFRIGLKDDGTVTFEDKGGPFSKVDLGIVKYHFEVGAEYIKSQS